MLSGCATRPALAVFAGLNLLDVASTYVALQMGLAEVNPLPSLLLANGGEGAMYLFKIAITLLVIVTVVRLSPYYRRLGYAVYAANGILALIVLLNTAQALAA